MRFLICDVYKDYYCFMEFLMGLLNRPNWVVNDGGFDFSVGS